MIVPNKAISYENSLLSKLPKVLHAFEEGENSVVDLYLKTRSEFADLTQFMIALDMLFILERIEIVSGELKRC